MFKYPNIPQTYMLYNDETGQAYVGSTACIETRVSKHFGDLKKNRHYNPGLQEAFNNNPSFKMYSVEMLSREDAYDYEQAILDDSKDDPCLLNIGLDARAAMKGRTLSQEAKEKISRLHTGNTYNLGKKRTPEQIQRALDGRISFKHSEETKRKIGESNAVALKGRTLAPEHKEKVVAPLLSSNSARSKQVNIDGLVYESLNDAARSLGLNPGTVYHRLHHPKGSYADWKFV